MTRKLLWAGALALALTTLHARAGDLANVNGSSAPVQNPGGYAPAVAAYTPTTQAPNMGQIKITTGGVVQCLPTAIPPNGIVVKAKDTNGGNGFCGGTGVTTTDDGTGNGYRIKPGEACTFTTSNANAACVNDPVAGDVFYFEVQ